MKHIYTITAARGIGKSTAIATYPKPTPEDMAKMAVIDTEDSMSDIVGHLDRKKMPFGAYIRMFDRFQMSDDMLDNISRGKLPWVTGRQKSALVDYYHHFIETVSEKLEKGKFEYLGIDTVEPIEAAIAAWAETNKKESGWSGSRAYGRLETEAVRPLYENMLESFHMRGVKTIIMTSHLKRVWEDDKPVLNKVKPGGRLAVLSRISSMMLWLVHEPGNSDRAPAAIVLKARKGIYDVVDGEWKVRRAMPERVPHFSWKDIRRYEQEGCDWDNPAPGEKLRDNEREMISEMFTDEQMKLMIIAAERDLEMTKATVQPVVPYDDKSDDSVKVQALMDEGKTAPQVASELDMALPKVLRIFRSEGK